MPDPNEVETVENDQISNDATGSEVDVTASAPTETFDRGELEAKVAANLEAAKTAFGDEDYSDASEEVTDDKPVDETPVTDEKTDEAEAAVDDEIEEQPESQSQTPTLPAEFRRSLKAYGWTDEEINDNTRQFGAKFLETAQKLHANRSAEVAKWAELGRAEKQRQAEATKDQPKPADPYDSPLKPIDAEKLKKVYGETELIDALVGPVNDTVNRINAMLPVIQQTQQVSEQAKLETLNTHINSFFGGEELKPYEKVYGSNDTTLTEKQIESRNKVLETADALLYGAKQQGRQLSVNDALTLAHDSVSSSYKEQAVRESLKKQLKTRAKSVSLKPGGRRAAPVKTNTKSDLEKRVSQGLASVFG